MIPPNAIPSAATLLTPVAATINHLLAQEPWARQTLLPHAGKVACIDAGAVALRLRVTADGMAEIALADAEPAVTIRVKLSDLPMIAQNRDRAFSYVKIEGDAEFANTISQLSKGLRWEAEHDLEKVLGPIIATRLVAGAKSAVAAARAGHQKLAENVAEYFLDEQPMLIRPTTLHDYSAGVTRMRDNVERLAKRIARLEKALPPQTTPDVST